MKTCSICHKISATGEDHIDCLEKIKVELEADQVTQILEKMDLGKNPNDIHVEIKAILESISKEKTKSE